jgi:hypothetical protein
MRPVGNQYAGELFAGPPSGNVGAHGAFRAR